jgi:hypothetical protein
MGRLSRLEENRALVGFVPTSYEIRPRRPAGPLTARGVAPFQAKALDGPSARGPPDVRTRVGTRRREGKVSSEAGADVAAREGTRTS